MKCKICNSQLIENQIMGSEEYTCPVCDEKPVTQSQKLIEFDATQYEIHICKNMEYDISMLKAVAKICSCNVLQAKVILEETGFIFKEMDAIETKKLKMLIDEKGIKYDINPCFQW